MKATQRHGSSGLVQIDELVRTDVCPECGGTGICTRYVSGSRTTGHYQLRYTPNPPVPCKCVSTS